MFFIHQVVPGPEGHQVSVVGRRRDGHRARAAHVGVTQLVGEDLQLVRRETIVIPKHVVVGGPACSLEADRGSETQRSLRGQRQQAEPSRCRARSSPRTDSDAITRHRKGHQEIYFVRRVSTDHTHLFTYKKTQKRHETLEQRLFRRLHHRTDAGFYDALLTGKKNISLSSCVDNTLKRELAHVLLYAVCVAGNLLKRKELGAGSLAPKHGAASQLPHGSAGPLPPPARPGSLLGPRGRCHVPAPPPLCHFVGGRQRGGAAGQSV